MWQLQSDGPLVDHNFCCCRHNFYGHHPAMIRNQGPGGILPNPNRLTTPTLSTPPQPPAYPQKKPKWKQELQILLKRSRCIWYWIILGYFQSYSWLYWSSSFYSLSLYISSDSINAQVLHTSRSLKPIMMMLMILMMVLPFVLKKLVGFYSHLIPWPLVT